MKITNDENGQIKSSMTFDELAILAHCVTECLHREDPSYFSTVFGYEKDQVERLGRDLNRFFVNFNERKDNK